MLPYSGFWHKMAKADLFDLKIWDQYVHKGYQRRVTMRGGWVTVPLVKGPVTDPINVKRLAAGATGHLADEIVKRYTHGARKPAFWDVHGPRICDEILSIRTDVLWELNFRLILLVRDLLGIETPLTFSRPAGENERGSAGIISVIRAFDGPMEYLSGTGARTYMGDCAEFVEAGIPVVWSRHRPVTGDSILTVLFDHEDPLSVVLTEDEPHEHRGERVGVRDAVLAGRS
nr:WbqC family protein [Aeromicrobium sp. CFBP 8757]